MGVAGKKEVGKHGHSREKLDILKCPSDPDLNQFMGGEMGDIFSVEDDLSHLGLIESGDTVQKAGFSGAVGTDHCKQFAGPNGEIYIVKCDDTAETERNTLDIQFRLPFGCIASVIDGWFSPERLHLLFLTPTCNQPGVLNDVQELLAGFFPFYF
jgi:hypothetical protein